MATLPTIGELRFDPETNNTFVYTGAVWGYLDGLYEENIIDDLACIINKYPKSEITEHLKAIVEMCKMGFYK